MFGEKVVAGFDPAEYEAALRSIEVWVEDFMWKRFIALVAVLQVAATLWADDPWKGKPYKQWDEKDIRRIMTDSPWIKGASVIKSWAPAAGTAANPLGASGSASSNTPQDVLRNANPSAGPAEAVFVVRWASSRTIRRAMARDAILHGTPEADAEKPLSVEPPAYLIVVLGQDMTPFEGASESDLKELKEKSFLASKKTRTRILPAGVELGRSPDGKKVHAVVFSFPKMTQAGDATIAADEKGVEFVCQFGKLNLRTNFDPQKMVDAGGRDL